jgi:hypothetical protein
MHVSPAQRAHHLGGIQVGEVLNILLKKRKKRTRRKRGKRRRKKGMTGKRQGDGRQELYTN